MLNNHVLIISNNWYCY